MQESSKNRSFLLVQIGVEKTLLGVSIFSSTVFKEKVDQIGVEKTLLGVNIFSSTVSKEKVKVLL